VAARLAALAEPSGICVSARVHEDVVGKLDLAFEDMGEQALKNIARPVRVYRVATGPVSAAAPEHLPYGSPTSHRSRCCPSRMHQPNVDAREP